MVFKSITHNKFDWSWEGSKDGRNTRSVVWPIHYKRRLEAGRLEFGGAMNEAKRKLVGQQARLEAVL
jgi:hypothetical protein